MAKFTLWGVIASPYQLKMQSLLDYAQHSWERWPDQGGRWSSLLMARDLARAKRRGAIKRFPAMSPELDEYPSVPFYTEDGADFYYDSTALAYYLDVHPDRHPATLVPTAPRLRFVSQLLDEAFDEFGLYMVHHMRWVGSARTTPMGEMTAREFRYLLPLGLRRRQARHLPRRQVRRCPYLFSVAPEGFDTGVSADRTPPARPGFPPTHEILESAWREYLAAMEHVLGEQRYLLGERFTLADASAYGQLSMNLVDGAAAQRLEKLAPRTYRWLCAIREGEHIGSRGELSLSPALQPLLAIIGRTFVPLMTQNANAHRQAVASGETLFNEAAFNRNHSLYDGQLLDRPYRAVVKTFQVRVWCEIKDSWRELDDVDRGYLEDTLLPGAGAMFGDVHQDVS